MIAHPMIGFAAVFIEAVGVLLVKKSLVLPYTLLVIMTVVIFFMV